jgi:hypothetical protein
MLYKIRGVISKNSVIFHYLFVQRCWHPSTFPFKWYTPWKSSYMTEIFCGFKNRLSRHWHKLYILRWQFMSYFDIYVAYQKWSPFKLCTNPTKFNLLMDSFCGFHFQFFLRHRLFVCHKLIGRSMSVWSDGNKAPQVTRSVTRVHTTDNNFKRNYLPR